MSVGPVEYVILGFPGNQFTGQIVPELAKLIDSGLVRIIDLTFIMKMPPATWRWSSTTLFEELAAFAGLDAEVGGILTDEDVALRRSEPRAEHLSSADHLGGHLGGPVRRSSAQCERRDPRGRTNPARDHRRGNGRPGRRPRLRSANPHHSRRMALRRRRQHNRRRLTCRSDDVDPLREWRRPRSWPGPQPTWEPSPRSGAPRPTRARPRPRPRLPPLQRMNPPRRKPPHPKPPRARRSNRSSSLPPSGPGHPYRGGVRRLEGKDPGDLTAQPVHTGRRVPAGAGPLRQCPVPRPAGLIRPAGLGLRLPPRNRKPGTIPRALVHSGPPEHRYS